MPKPDWSPPVVRDDGIHMHGNYPANHGLRADALARKGAKHDPDGLIGDDLIEDARKALPTPAQRAKERNAPRRKTPAPPPPQAHADEPPAGSAEPQE